MQVLTGTKSCLVYSRKRRRILMPGTVQAWGKRREEIQRYSRSPMTWDLVSHYKVELLL